MNSFTALIPKLSLSLNRANFPKVLLAHKLYSTEVKEEIVIPKTIPRGPTDILRALESTITRDPTAAHYKYHDDPFLTPMSNLGKRTFAMAQEAGRKAAHWVRQENGDLFQHQEADPMIKAFAPKLVYTETSEVTEEDLKKVIKDAFVSDATLIYKLLKDKGLIISAETQESLLELLCCYNHDDPLPEEFIEERWFRQSSGKERQRKTWKDGLLSEEIFISIDNPSAEAYSAIIQGMTKFGQVDRAWQLFEDSQKKGLVVSTDTYNSLISVASFLKEDYDLRWSFVTDMLSGMARAQNKPNLGTLNALLKTLSTLGSGKHVKQNVLKVLSEFKALGIEPSLASWYYVLITYCKERKS